MIAEVPFFGVKFSQRLNTPGSFSANLNLRDSSAQALNLLEGTQPSRTALFVDFLGQIVWGGIIWTRQYSRQQAAQIPIGGKEFWSYFTQRVQAKDYTTPPGSGAYWSTNPADPMATALQVVSDALAVPGSALAAGSGFPLTLNANNGVPTPSGEWISSSYPLTQYQSIDTMVSQLSQMGYGPGFDFAIDCAYGAGQQSGSLPVLSLNLSNPTRGLQVGTSGLTIITANQDDYGFPEDGTQQGTTCYDTASSGATLTAIQSNPQPIDNGYPLLEQVINYNNIASQQTLNSIAQNDSVMYAYPVIAPWAQFSVFDDPPLGSFKTGDAVRWIIDPDERFVAGLDWYWRIVGIDVDAPDQGRVTTKLTFNLPSGTSAVAPPTA